MILEKARSKSSLMFVDTAGVTGPEDIKGIFENVPTKEKSIGKGDFVYKEGQPSNEIYWIKTGSIKVAKLGDSNIEVVKSILESGNIFGEKVLAGEDQRTEFAQAITTDTVIQVYRFDDILDAVKLDPSLSLRLLTLLGTRLVSLERRIESIISKDSRTRIIDFLREMAQQSGKKVGFETLIKNNFTHKDIASLTGTSRQTVTTTLNSLKEKNIINFDRRRILIRDMDLLK